MAALVFLSWLCQAVLRRCIALAILILSLLALAGVLSSGPLVLWLLVGLALTVLI